MPTEWNRDDARARIRRRIQEIAGESGRRWREIDDDELIPESGLLDSADVLSLIIWCEQEFGRELKLEDINVDSFGSVNRMLDFLGGRSK